MKTSGDGIGCKACAWFSRHERPNDEVDRSFTNFQVTGLAAQKSYFQRHRRSQRHRDALDAYLKHLIDSCSDGKTKSPAVSCAPSEDEFKVLWKQLASGSTDSLASNISARRATTMEWCLFEAIRDADRAFLSTASTITISLDERKGCLMMRFVA